MAETQLIQFDAARRALALATKIDEVKEIRDKAEALRLYFRQAGQGLEMQNQCAEIKIRAEVRAGELLAETVEAHRPSELLHDVTVIPEGISRVQSSRWQAMAEVPEKVREAHIADVKGRGHELTSAGILKIAKITRKREPKPGPVSPLAEKSPRLIVGRAESMPQVAGESVDIIITSPPYNLGAEDWPMGGDGRVPREGGIGYEDTLKEADYQSWQVACLREMFRVSRQGGSLFYNHKVRIHGGQMIHPMQWLLSSDNPWIMRQEIIWDRGSTHNHSPSLFWPHDERIYWMTKGNPTLPDRPIGTSTIWTCHGPVAYTWHPAPFREELPKLLLGAIGREGISVLDPFAGSCTTLKVALSLGYEAIGVDISDKYLSRAAEENGWTTTLES